MDFSQPIDRRHTNSYKWQSPDPDVLPLWVADMDFETAPPVKAAVMRRAAHGVYGYVKVPESYYTAVADWFLRRHGFAIAREWIIPTTGVVPALSAVIQALSEQGDKALVLTPVYNCFFSSLRNSGVEIVASPLTDDFRVDFDDFERRASDPLLKLFILCNPHNPAGRVWTREELTRMGEICLRHGVFVVSDEIHCELVMPGHRFTPFASLSRAFLLHSATCSSPSKAFNTAGLQMANIVVADPSLRARIDKQININEVCDVNPFGPVALEAAYSREGEEWLLDLIRYLHANYLFLVEFFRRHMPFLRVAPLEGTYLVWVDCAALGLPAHTLCERLLAEQKLWLNEGEMYEGGPSTHIRINIALPRERLGEALTRLRNAVESYGF